jgi:hypothetical protein
MEVGTWSLAGLVLRCCRRDTEVVDCWMDASKKAHGKPRVENKFLYWWTGVVLCPILRRKMGCCFHP